MVGQRFAAFTPEASPDYYTADHRPRYITPVNKNNKYLVYHLRSPIESPLVKHRGFALYDNPHDDTRPALVGYYLEDIGIVDPHRVREIRD